MKTGGGKVDQKKKLRRFQGAIDELICVDAKNQEIYSQGNVKQLQRVQNERNKSCVWSLCNEITGREQLTEG